MTIWLLTMKSTSDKLDSITILPTSDIHAHFRRNMDVTATMDIADLTIIMNQQNVRDMAHEFLKHINTLKGWMSNDIYKKARNSILEVFREIVDQDEMVNHMNKRNIMGPLTLVTSLGIKVNLQAIRTKK